MIDTINYLKIAYLFVWFLLFIFIFWGIVSINKIDKILKRKNDKS